MQGLPAPTPRTPQGSPWEINYFPPGYKNTRSWILTQSWIQRKEEGRGDRVPSIFTSCIIYSFTQQNTYYVDQALLQAVGKQFKIEQTKASYSFLSSLEEGIAPLFDPTHGLPCTD